MWMLVQRLAIKAASKAVKIDVSDVMTQMNGSDILTLLKGLL